MAVMIVVICDGRLPSDLRCRASFPTHVHTRHAALFHARTAGWIRLSNGTDLCPACSLRGGHT